MTAIMKVAAPRAEPMPACPATITATRRFAQARWDMDLQADTAATALRRRERTMIERRGSGDARAADVFGWLSLTAVIIGAKATLVTQLARLDDLEGALAGVIAEGGIAGRVAPLDQPLGDVAVGPLTVPDVGSRAGWALARLAASAATSSGVAIRGQLQGSAPILADLKARFKAATKGRP